MRRTPLKYKLNRIDIPIIVGIVILMVPGLMLLTGLIWGIYKLYSHWKKEK